MRIVSEDTCIGMNTSVILVLRLVWAVAGLHSWHACVRIDFLRQLWVSTATTCDLSKLLLCIFVTDCNAYKKARAMDNFEVRNGCFVLELSRFISYIVGQ